MKRVVMFIAAAAVAMAAACGDDASQVNGLPIGPAARGTGPDTSGNSGSGTPTSNGPVANVLVTPHAAIVSVGSYVSLVAWATDAAGVHVAKRATWRSADPSIAVVSDTGPVFGKAIGTTKVYATVDGFSDSAVVQVVPAPPNGGGSGGGGGQTPQPVSQFNMTVVAMGAIPGTDTSHTERISGATVTLERRGGVSGDTLKTPEPAGFATTNANGEAKFSNLAGGTYSIRITPPSGSVYAETMSGIAPPRQSDISVFVTLRRP